jgi:hypothetical protein
MMGAALCAALWATGCMPESELDCRLSSDCPADHYCVRSRCAPDWEEAERRPTRPTVVREVRRPGPDGGADDASDAEPGDSSPCPGARIAGPGDLVLNEILVDVPPGDIGDANRDGVRDAFDDEFVEMVNRSNAEISLDGLQLLGGDRVRHVLSDVCLGPGEAVVVFGGEARPGVVAPGEPGVLVVVSDRRLGFANDGGVFRVRDALGRLVLEHIYERGGEHSRTLWPQVTGSLYEEHPDISAGSLFSPGRCADGRPLTTRCVSEAGVSDAGSLDASHARDLGGI